MPKRTTKSRKLTAEQGMHNGIRSYNIGIFENTMAKIKDDASLGKVINESSSKIFKQI